MVRREGEEGGGEGERNRGKEGVRGKGRVREGGRDSWLGSKGRVQSNKTSMFKGPEAGERVRVVH